MSRRVWGLGVAGLVVSVCVSAAPSATAAPPIRPQALPAGFTQSNVASVTSPTGVYPMPDGSVVVLQQGGEVRVIQNGTLVPAVALDLPNNCIASERGLLGFAVDPEFTANRFVYLYYTRTPGGPGTCLNRVSRFTMPTATTIELASEKVLLDNISSIAGNHNAGDLDFGRDGFLYVTTGDAGSDPRADSSTNDAAQDLSLLNGKILRVDKATGEGAPGNPFPLGGTGTSCRVGGTTIPTSARCAEIYAWGLRNPFRFAFDPNGATQRFFINDVGGSTREEVDEGGLGLNYGWPSREGVCPRGSNPPCAGPPAGITDPFTDYPRSVGTYITGGAFIPNGIWPAAYDGGYLFADGGTGKIFLRRADGTIDYANPFATDVGQIADLAFVRENGVTVLYVTIAGSSSNSVKKIVGPAPTQPQPPSAALQHVSLSPGTRILDTRETSGGAAPIPAQTPRTLVTGVNGAVTKAVLVNLAYVAPAADGFLTAWAAGAAMPGTANVNARAGEVVSNLAIVPVSASGAISLYSLSAAHVVVDLLGRFDTASGAVSAGRFVAVDPIRLADTRLPVATDTNEYAHIIQPILPPAPTSTVTVPILGRRGRVPGSGVSSVVLVVTALSRPSTAGGWVTAFPTGTAWPGTANVNTTGGDDIRPNTVVVPVGASGAVDLRLFNVDNVVVDVVGYFTDGSAPAATAGRFISIPPTREADSRVSMGFARLAANTSRTLDPGSVPASAGGIVHNIAIVNNDGPGFVTPYPAAPVPLVAAGNVTAPGQVRSISTMTKLGAGGLINYYAFMGTDLVIDVTGYFEG